MQHPGHASACEASCPQEQDELVKFSGCTVSTEIGPSTVLWSRTQRCLHLPWPGQTWCQSPQHSLLLPMAAFLAGWWFCQLKNKRGWVPAAYLEPLDGPDESEEQEPNYAGKMLG